MVNTFLSLIDVVLMPYACTDGDYIRGIQVRAAKVFSGISRLG